MFTTGICRTTCFCSGYCWICMSFLFIFYWSILMKFDEVWLNLMKFDDYIFDFWWTFMKFVYFVPNNVSWFSRHSFITPFGPFRFLIRKKERYRILYFEEGEKIWSARHSHQSEYIYAVFEEAREEHVLECEACQCQRQKMMNTTEPVPLALKDLIEISWNFTLIF